MSADALLTPERCDCCGRFVNLGGPGVSWSQSYTLNDLHEPTHRCSPCTDRHGIKQSNCNPLSGPWSGRNPRSQDEH